MQMQERTRSMNLSGLAMRALITSPVILLAFLVWEMHRFYTIGRTILPGLGVLLGFLNPPDDYLASRGSVDMRPAESEYRIDYSHKYHGGYFLELKAHGDADITEKIKSGLSFSCTYHGRDGMTIRQKATAELVLHSNGRGILFGIIDAYDVPRNLPIDGIVSVAVRVNGDVKSFLAKYPSCKLSVEKYSDK